MADVDNIGRWYKYGKKLLDEIAASNPEKGEAHIWFTGQHGFIINLAGIVFYIDVILNDLTDENGKSFRSYPPPFSPYETQRVDYVLCTHNHADHLNMNTLLPIFKSNPNVCFVVPSPYKKLLIDAEIPDSNILPAKAHEIIPIKKSNLSILPVPAIHTRYIQDEGEKNQNGDYTSLGFIIQDDDIRIYHSGDTWAVSSLVEKLKAISPINAAILPINGTDWERTGKGLIGNMGYLDAVKMAQEIPIDLVIPSHYDMIAGNSENPARLADAMYSLCPQKKYHIFALGERFIYRR